MKAFEKYLSLWVILSILAGIAIGILLPSVPVALGKLEYAHVSIPIAILIWVMIYPMMLKIDFQSVRNIGRQPKGLVITCITNWLIKPFTMFGLAWFFLHVVFRPIIPEELASEYLAGIFLVNGRLSGQVNTWGLTCGLMSAVALQGTSALARDEGVFFCGDEIA